MGEDGGDAGENIALVAWKVSSDWRIVLEMVSRPMGRSTTNAHDTSKRSTLTSIQQRFLALGLVPYGLMLSELQKREG
jgi:hypothetical protein